MSLEHPLGRFILVQGIRYFAAAQAFPMVFFHAGWILLAVATWGHAAEPGGAVGAVTRGLVRAYGWLGGVDAQGHGDEDGLMVVWARLALVLYAIEAVWRWLFGERKPVRLLRIAALSTGVALVGYVAAFLPTGDLAEAALVVIGFSMLAGLATAWSVGMHRLAAALELRLDGADKPGPGVVGP